ncbi:hypothetical protein WA538_002279 [Blastocystis sp. DL]
MSAKRDHVETVSQTEIEGQEEMMKRFKGKKIFEWKEDTKREWLLSVSCTAQFPDTPFFVCKQVLNSIYTTAFDAKKQWTLDTLCQTWQSQERDIGLIISFSDSSVYYYDTDDFDDWGIILDQVSFKSNLPSEEELVALLKSIFQFQQENPNLLIGFMDFTVSSLPFYIIAQYIGRDKKIPLPSVVASLQIDHYIRDESVRKALSLPLPSSSHPPSLPSPNQTILNAFHTLTHHSLCLPMKINPPIATLPDDGDWLCSWNPEGDRLFLFITKGKGYLIGVRDNANFLFGEMPNTFVTAARKPHESTVCEGVLVTETAMSPPLRRLLLSDVLYINGMSLKSLPYAQRVSALRKEVVDRVHERKQQDLERVQRSPFKSVGLREFWPLKQLEKVRHSLIPSLTHGCKGVVVLDGKAPYCYGDQPSRYWEWNGWCVCCELQWM